MDEATRNPGIIMDQRRVPRGDLAPADDADRSAQRAIYAEMCSAAERDAKTGALPPVLKEVSDAISKPKQAKYVSLAAGRGAIQQSRCHVTAD